MSGTDRAGKHERLDECATEQARDSVERAEAGDTASTDRLGKAREADPAGAEAAEQEASDGPEGRGLAR